MLCLATRPPRTDTSVLFDTPLGTLPVDSLRQASRGSLLFCGLAAIQVVLGSAY